VKHEAILEVGIGENNRLFVRPIESDFAHIFRTASGVNWDKEKRALLGSESREWSASLWFENILISVADEYGIVLLIAPSTRWSGVDSKSQSEMETFSESDWANQFLARQREAGVRHLMDLQLS
jgi:hypothetical protein